MITWSFFGQEGRRALTADQTGANLPSEYGPWNKFKIIELRGDNEEEEEIRAHVQRRGFYLFERDKSADDAKGS